MELLFLIFLCSTGRGWKKDDCILRNAGLGGLSHWDLLSPSLQVLLLFLSQIIFRPSKGPFFSLSLFFIQRTRWSISLVDRKLYFWVLGQVQIFFKFVVYYWPVSYLNMNVSRQSYTLNGIINFMLQLLQVWKGERWKTILTEASRESSGRRGGQGRREWRGRRGRHREDHSIPKVAWQHDSAGMTICSCSCCSCFWLGNRVRLIF